MPTPFRCLIAATLCCAATAVACDADGPIGPPGQNQFGIAEMRVSPALDTIFLSDSLTGVETAQLMATAIGRDGGVVTPTILWSTSDPAVATVDESGRVRGLTFGEVTITALARVRGSATVRVLPQTAAIALTSPAAQVVFGDPLQMTAVARDHEGRPVPRVAYVWSSSNSSIAAVDQRGRLTLAGNGTVRISVAGNRASASADVTVLPRAISQVDVGADAVCGVVSLGRAYCWGLNDVNQLGTPADSSCFSDEANVVPRPCEITPERTGAELAFGQVSAGDSLSCGVTTGQRVYCWGLNTSGQVGNGQIGPSAVVSPASVFTSQAFTTVSAGGAHACALTPAGAAFCWGNDESGQLGDARRVSSTTPIPVIGALSFSQISAGDSHTCGITTTGFAFCWGAGTDGQLGTGGTADSDVPAAVAGGLTFTSISAGHAHTCGVAVGGALHCWGSNALGALGTGVLGGIQSTPALVGTGFATVSSGANLTCARAPSGAAACWGTNSHGQLGNGAVSGASGSPVSVAGGLSFASVSAGRRHACGVTTDGRTYCWGSNVFGALGDELQATVRGTPVLVNVVR